MLIDSVVMISRFGLFDIAILTAAVHLHIGMALVEVFLSDELGEYKAFRKFNHTVFIG